VFGKPGADGAFQNAAMETLAQESLCLGERVAEVKGKVEMLSRMILSGQVLCLPVGAGEALETFRALEDLQCLQAVAAFAFLDDVRTAASRAGGILLCDGGWHAGRLTKWVMRWVIGE